MTTKSAVIDFGWANGWKEKPALVVKCREAKHRPSDIDIGPPFRGMEHVVRCDQCGYVYRYDSSD